MVISGCTGSGHPRLVPWIAAAPPPYAPAATSTPPALPAKARPCQSIDVSANVGSGNGAGGHSVTYIRFRNVGYSPCLLIGYPGVTAIERGRPDVVGTRGSFFTSGRPADMPPRTGITLLGLESDSYCAARSGGGGGGDDYSHFTVTLPGGDTVRLAVPGRGLDLTCGLHLTQFFDPDYPQAQVIYPLAPLRATLVLPQTALAGRPLDYEVDLHNPTTSAVSLQPCPAYVEAAHSPTPVKKTYALNCAPVKTIAAGQTVRFAMRLPIPGDTPAGQLRIEWGMAPNTALSGTVVISG